MKLCLLGKDRIETIMIPDEADENASLIKSFHGSEDYQFSLDFTGGKWYLKSNNMIHVLNNGTPVNKTVLNNYQYYIATAIGTNRQFFIYTLPDKDQNVFNLDISRLTRVAVGNNQSCDIVYQNASFVLERPNGQSGYTLNCTDPNVMVYVNNVAVVGTRILRAGDTIFSNGFRMIYMGRFVNINNPNNSVYAAKLSKYTISTNNQEFTQSNDDAASITLYNETDYFYHTLRMDNMNEEVEIIIDPPPGSAEKDDVPFLLTMGSSITMMASTVVMTFSVINQFQSPNKSFLTIFPQILMLVAMIIGSLIIPKALSRYMKKKAKDREDLRLRKYNEYLDKKQAEIVEAKKKQEQNLRDNNPNTYDCYQILADTDKINNVKFWSRRVTDNDFLTLRLGIGNLKSQLRISAPEKHFTLDEDNLLERAFEVAAIGKELNNVPITVSLLQKNITGIIFNSSNEADYIHNLILQLITLHSSNDLKIIVFTNEANAKKWDYVKYLPHCWSDDKEVRFFATNKDEMENVSVYLEEIYKERQSKQPQDEGVETKAEKEKFEKKDEYKNYDTYYLLINDDYNLSKNTLIVDLLIKTATNFGFSYLCIGEKMRELPSICKAFVEVRDKKGAVITEEIGEYGPKKITQDFVTEYVANIDMRYLSDKLANVPMITKDGLTSLPNSLNFLEMLKVSKIEQLDSLNRWKTNNPVQSLSTIIGVHTNGDDFKLDLHEKFHGPHGLVAGSTGSGKSEFIITYILSMAINYHPYEVQFVLIDYKGGGLAGAFENKETGVRIPHLVGTITNLDVAEMNRTLVSIQSELKRRQRVFNEVRDRLDEGTVDIYKYQRLYREGVVDEPMAHLFIISDEFAELKAQQPDFMDQLIQTARIGRSLGVHLILATQKPSGVVNDQIWANSKFKVCLKVQERGDSMEMLKRPEAAAIKEAGRFYLQVGYNDYFDIGQSGWSGAKYLPSDKILKKIDDSINFVNNTGYKIKSIKDTVKVDTSVNLGEQLTNVVKYIYNLGKKENINTTKLWLDALPADINLNTLKQRYNYRPTPYFINPVIGEYDNPENQEQGLLNLNMTNNGNTLIYGQTGSGKELLLSTIVWSCMAEHTPDEINMYIIDCGAETLKMFNNIPQVGEVATLEDNDLVYDIFNMLHDEIDRRKELFADYAGSYIEYCNNSGNKLPLILTIINNYEIFVENFSKLSESVQTMYRDGSKYGIMFVISATATNAVRGRMAQNFNNKICLQIPNESEYREILGSPRGKTPSKLFGRGMIAVEKTALEFQTAVFAERKDMVNVTRSTAVQLNNAYTSRAKKIPVIPKQILLSKFLEEEYTLKDVPIGYNIDSKAITKYNFMQPILPILSSSITLERFSFIKSIISLISKLENTQVRVIDFEKVYESINPDIKVWNDNYEDALVEIYNEMAKNKNTNTEYYYMMLGIGEVRKKVSEQCMEIVERIFNSMPEYTNCHILLIDSYSAYKNLQIETWYQSSINPLNGLWLGNEVQNQMAINIPKLTMDDKNLDFLYQVYAVENGNYTVLKCVVEDEVGANEG